MKDMNDLKVKINALFPSMSNKKKRIAKYILNNYDKAKTETISQISEKCGVSPGSISLFAQDLGLNGFKELSVLMSNDNDYNNFLNVVTDQSNSSDIINKIVESNIENIKSTSKNINIQAVEKASQWIINSEQVIIFGLGGSAGIAAEAYNMFLKTQVNIKFNQDYHIQLVLAGKMSSKDCAIIISHSGNNEDIQRIVKILKTNKVKIIAITSFANTNLTKKADIYFLSITDEFKYDAIPIYSRRITQMLILDILFTIVVHQDSKKTVPSLKKLRQALQLTNKNNF